MMLNLPTTLTGLIVYAIGLVILWVIVSIPVYFAGKLFTGGKSDFGDAMGATLGGGLVYLIILFGVTIFLGSVLGAAAGPFAIVLALLGWLAVYRASFRTSWPKAVAIVIFSWVILVILDYVLLHAFQVSFPEFFPF